MAFHAGSGPVEWIKAGPFSFALAAGERPTTDGGWRPLEGMGALALSFALGAFAFSLRAPGSALETRRFVGEMPEAPLHEEVVCSGALVALRLASDIFVKLVGGHLCDQFVVEVGVGVVAVLLVVAVVGGAGGAVRPAIVVVVRRITAAISKRRETVEGLSLDGVVVGVVVPVVDVVARIALNARR